MHPQATKHRQVTTVSGHQKDACIKSVVTYNIILYSKASRSSLATSVCRFCKLRLAVKKLATTLRDMPDTPPRRYVWRKAGKVCRLLPTPTLGVRRHLLDVRR